MSMCSYRVYVRRAGCPLRRGLHLLTCCAPVVVVHGPAPGPGRVLATSGHLAVHRIGHRKTEISHVRRVRAVGRSSVYYKARARPLACRLGFAFAPPRTGRLFTHTADGDARGDGLVLWCLLCLEFLVFTCTC